MGGVIGGLEVGKKVEGLEGGKERFVCVCVCV